MIEHDLDGAPENYTLKESLHLLKSTVQSLHDVLLSNETVASGSSSGSFFTPPVEGRKGPGRPIIVISKDQIEYLRTIHFSWEKIAKLLGISVSPLQRRRKKFEIDDKLEKFSNISDEQLDLIYKELTAPDTNQARGGFLTPNIGRRRFIGALRS